jgi:phosphatidylethanolamine/phosphatidyl-N-methylethanolamine N-methyltransferase
MPQSSAASAQAQTRTEAAYSRWAPIYDLIFDLPFHPGRLAASRAAAAAAGADGAMLVVGVGTGLELELLPADLRVTGVDISAAMLDVARERVARKGLRQVRSLQVMDAGAMDFADGQFDVALAPYVMSVVPNPARVLNEVWRVIRPGGRMVVMNHFAAAGDGESRLVARLASEVSLCGGRRLDRRPTGRRADRAARAVAAAAIHLARHRQARLCPVNPASGADAHRL